MKRTASLFFLVAAVATGTLMAQGRGGPHGQGGPHSQGVFISPGASQTLPPGLAKRSGDLPPGLQRHIERTGQLPPGLEKRTAPSFGRPVFVPRGRGNGLPPGLAKRNGNLPPGLQRHIARTGHLPPGLERKRGRSVFFLNRHHRAFRPMRPEERGEVRRHHRG